MNKKTCFSEQAILEDIPPQLLVKVISRIYSNDIEKINLFKNSEKQFMIDLIVSTKPFEASYGDVICGEGYQFYKI